MADLTPLPPATGPYFNDRPASPAPVPTVTWVALATGVIAIAGVVGLAWQSQSRDEAVQQAMGNKVAALDRQLVESTALTKRLQAQVVEAQNRLEAFEAKLADTQTQRIALEEMYRELSRAPDDWLLAEVEQTINIAAQQHDANPRLFSLSPSAAQIGHQKGKTYPQKDGYKRNKKVVTDLYL